MEIYSKPNRMSEHESKIKTKFTTSCKIMIFKRLIFMQKYYILYIFVRGIDQHLHLYFGSGELTHQKLFISMVTGWLIPPFASRYSRKTWCEPDISKESKQIICSYIIIFHSNTLFSLYLLIKIIISIDFLVTRA